MNEQFRNEPELQEGPPVGGHRERFLQRLAQEEAKKKGKVRYMPWLFGLAAIAAVFLAFITIGFPEGGNGEVAQTNEKINTYAQLDKRTAALDVTFSKHVEPHLDYIGTQAPELKQQIALLEQLDKEYDKLRKLLNEKENQQKITSEMIRNHRMRLKIMDQLLVQLEIINKQKTSYDEKNSI